ncbi:hypothetical protein C8R47DRAFT_1083569 [Mycena vitilis]|nr:hypothetical protein C8R47DRAFT_1083569 [Mycena vitilis]
MQTPNDNESSTKNLLLRFTQLPPVNAAAVAGFMDKGQILNAPRVNFKAGVERGCKDSPSSPGDNTAMQVRALGTRFVNAVQTKGNLLDIEMAKEIYTHALWNKDVSVHGGFPQARVLNSISNHRSAQQPHLDRTVNDAVYRRDRIHTPFGSVWITVQQPPTPCTETKTSNQDRNISFGVQEILDKDSNKRKYQPGLQKEASVR